MDSAFPEPSIEDGKRCRPARNSDKNTLLAVMRILENYNLMSTAEVLKRETGLSTDASVITTSETDVNKVLSVYVDEGDPKLYHDSYAELRRFVENSLDIYKHELNAILYPIFVNMYLELIHNDYEMQAIDFMRTFGRVQESYFQQDVKRLSFITQKYQMSSCEIAEAFKVSAYTIRMSRDTVSILKRHLKEKEHSVLMNIIKKNLYFDVYEGVARNKKQIHVTAGAMIGEAKREDNKGKVYYGLLREPDLQSFFPPDEEDDGETSGDGEKPKKKKPRRDPLFNRKVKSDPNAPPFDRFPLPVLKDADKMEKVKSLREASKRVTLGPDTLPCILSYLVENSYETISCAETTDDVSILAVGFTCCKIMVFSLTPQKLKTMKPADQLQDINLESDDATIRIMDEGAGETVKKLIGHHAPVYGLSFSSDRTLLLSCSGDSTVRLWSLLMWRCLVVYKGHVNPIWSVQFSPHGYYFVTASRDKTARLWATDNYQVLRVFAGHYSDVECVKFHPNSNYVATGSADRTVRLWDCVSGSQVRLMTGHKGTVKALSFSMEGRFLASAGFDEDVFIWDIAHAHLLAIFSGHTSVVNSLTFSRDGNVLASGSHDLTIKIWDFSKFIEDISLEDINVCHNPEVKDNPESYLLESFEMKTTPLNLIFSRRNILFTVSGS